MRAVNFYDAVKPADTRESEAVPGYGVGGSDDKRVTAAVVLLGSQGRKK